MFRLDFYEKREIIKVKKFFCLVCLMFFCCSLIFALETENALFHIERSKNPNIVCYDAVLNSDGQINKQTPVDAYWIPLAEKAGKREELNTFDKKFYGFDTKYNEKDNNFDLILKFVEGKKMTILIIDGKPKVKILINNIESYLTKIYIQSTEKWLEKPSISYYALYGTTIDGNEPVEEKIIVK